MRARLVQLVTYVINETSTSSGWSKAYFDICQEFEGQYSRWGKWRIPVAEDFARGVAPIHIRARICDPPRSIHIRSTNVYQFARPNEIKLPVKGVPVNPAARQLNPAARYTRARKGELGQRPG